MTENLSTNLVSAEFKAALFARRNWTDAYAVEQLGRFLREAADELDRLTAEVSELRRDAERYRWLRDSAAYVGVNPYAKTCLWTLRGVYEIAGMGFDVAVDRAALGEQP